MMLLQLRHLQSPVRPIDSFGCVLLKSFREELQAKRKANFSTVLGQFNKKCHPGYLSNVRRQHYIFMYRRMLSSSSSSSSSSSWSNKKPPTQFFTSRKKILAESELFKPMLDQSSSISDPSSPSSVPRGIFSTNYNNLPPLSSSPSNDDIIHQYNNTIGKEEEIIIDPSSMYNPAIHLPNKPNFNDPKLNYEPSTQLGEEIMKYIAVKGSPITVAEYMRRCLRDEQFGYYTNPPSSNNNDETNEDYCYDEFTKEGRGHNLIGQQGDFTTAPEISQIFGECIAIWLLTQFEALHKPKQIQLVELGPGRGTLMCDILRTAKGIKGVGEEFIDALCSSSSSDNNSVTGVHFVEVSENLRSTQKEALMEMNQKYLNLWNNDEIEFNYHRWETKEEKQERIAKIMDKLHEKKESGKEMTDELLKEMLAEQKREKEEQHSDAIAATSNKTRISFHWHDNFDAIPFKTSSTSSKIKNITEASIPTFVLCQEFFDALPVHVFQKTEDGWREQLVDVAVEDEDDDNHQVEVKMLDGTTASINRSSTLNQLGIDNDSVSTSKKKSRFRFVLSPDITPAVKTLLRINKDGIEPPELSAAPVGTVMEVSPESLALIQDLALRIDECRGAALIVDYGNEGSKDTLRAFRRHEQTDVLSSPGMVDVTADVDFTAMKNAVNIDMVKTGMLKSAKDGSVTEVFGPKGQGEFLSSMGAVERTVQLIENDNTTDDQAEDLCTALERLVSVEEMGERFKVLSIGRKKDGIFPPPGF